MKKKLVSIVVLLVMLITALAPVIGGVAYGATTTNPTGNYTDASKKE